MGLSVQEGTLWSPWASGMQELWFQQLFHELPILSGLVRPENFLPLVATWWTERVNKGRDCAAPLPILPHSPTAAGGHLSCAWTGREGRWILCNLLCRWVRPIWQPPQGSLHAFHSSLPTHCHSTPLLDPDVQVKSKRKGELTAPADTHCSPYICLQPVVTIFICSFVNYF